jgi:hypothetical protein
MTTNSNTQPPAAGEAAHTLALPLGLSRSAVYDEIRDANGDLVAFCAILDPLKSKPALSQIVRACNSHAALLKLANRYLAVLNSADNEHADFLDSASDSLDMLRGIDEVEVAATLKLAEGK